MKNKFARTMDEAFPFGPEYGCAIQSYKQSSLAGPLVVYLVVVALLAGAWIYG